MSSSAITIEEAGTVTDLSPRVFYFWAPSSIQPRQGGEPSFPWKHQTSHEHTEATQAAKNPCSDSRDTG